LAKFGFGEERLAEAYPNLIHCSITGFGKDGPYSKRPAYDTVGIALSGIASLTVDPANPRIVGPTVSDNVTGMNACVGIIAALYARGRGQKARQVEVNMLESSIALIPDPIANFTQDGVLFGPTSRVAASQTFAFRCRDAELLAIHLSIPEKFWIGLLEALEAMTTIGADERFKDRRSRIANYQLLQDQLSAVIAEHPRHYWMQRLEHADIPFAPINTIADVMADPQVQHLGIFQSVTHSRHGETMCIRSPIRIDGERVDVQPAASLGEHSSEILLDLGYSSDDASELIREHLH
jgi:formyl-CoA transferase